MSSSIPSTDRLQSRIQSWLCLGLILATLALTFLSSPLVSMGTWNEFNFDMLGWLIFVLGGAMRWWSAFYRIEGTSPILAVSGPYSICRHPAQWGNLLFCISMACFLSSLTCLLGFVVAATVFFWLAIPAEERRLRETFGEQYDRYATAVPGLWPRFRLFRTPENIDIEKAMEDARLRLQAQLLRDAFHGTLSHELRRMAVWMWLPAIGKAAALCRAEIWWPHLVGLP